MKKYYPCLFLLLVMSGCNPVYFTQYTLVTKTPLQVYDHRDPEHATRYADIPAGDTIVVLSDKLFPNVPQVTKARYRNYNVWVTGAPTGAYRINKVRVTRRAYNRQRPVFASLSTLPIYSGSSVVTNSTPIVAKGREITSAYGSAGNISTSQNRGIKNKKPKKADSSKASYSHKNRKSRVKSGTSVEGMYPDTSDTRLVTKKNRKKTTNISTGSGSSYTGRSSYGYTPSTGATIHTGPKGGRYYINKNGNKIYVKKGSSSSSSYRSKSRSSSYGTRSRSYSTKSSSRSYYRKR